MPAALGSSASYPHAAISHCATLLLPFLWVDVYCVYHYFFVPPPRVLRPPKARIGTKGVAPTLRVSVI